MTRPTIPDTGSRTLPDFLIVGAAKSATTTLFHWLGQQPEVHLPVEKEPRFFSDERRWAEGIEPYMALFADARPGDLTGEASTAYTDPALAALCAERIADTVPGAKILYVVRHPIDRLRSHYRHQVQRGRERLPLAEAVLRPDNPYVGYSRYFTCFRPYLERFDDDRVAVIRTEDLHDGGSAWLRALSLLGLEDRPAPQVAYNATAEKAGFRRPMLWLYEHGWTSHLRHLPRPVRQLGRRTLMRRDDRYAQRLDGSLSPVPIEVARLIWRDVDRLEDHLGREMGWAREER
jgi:Sulfotransferase domain